MTESIRPSFETVRDLSRSYRCIPIFMETAGDLETPMRLLKRLRQKSPNCFILDSDDGDRLHSHGRRRRGALPAGPGGNLPDFRSYPDGKPARRRAVAPTNFAAEMAHTAGRGGIYVYCAQSQAVYPRRRHFSGGTFPPPHGGDTHGFAGYVSGTAGAQPVTLLYYLRMGGIEIAGASP